MKLKNLLRNNIILLVCLVTLIILAPLFGEKNAFAGNLLLTVIFFSGIFALDFSDQSLKILVPLGGVTAAVMWISYFVDMNLVYLVNNTATFFFLVAIVVLMVGHIARSQNVDATIILSSINGYLLLGVLGGVLLVISDNVDHRLSVPAGPGIHFPGESLPRFNDFVYFSFVTLSTLGYGDITPVSHLSRATTVFIAITGQLYMTILIAMLVGKFLTRSEGS